MSKKSRKLKPEYLKIKNKILLVQEFADHILTKEGEKALKNYILELYSLVLYSHHAGKITTNQYDKLNLYIKNNIRY